MDYSTLLKKYREKTFKTQREFAKELGISFVTLNRWETGKFNPTMKMKKKLHSIFLKEGLLEE